MITWFHKHRYDYCNSSSIDLHRSVGQALHRETTGHRFTVDFKESKTSWITFLKRLNDYYDHSGIYLCRLTGQGWQEGAIVHLICFWWHSSIEVTPKKDETFLRQLSDHPISNTTLWLLLQTKHRSLQISGTNIDIEEPLRFIHLWWNSNIDLDFILRKAETTGKSIYLNGS